MTYITPPHTHTPVRSINQYSMTFSPGSDPSMVFCLTFLIKRNGGGNNRSPLFPQSSEKMKF